MRLIVGVLSLLVVAAVVMMLAKQQLQAVGTMRMPAVPGAPGPTSGTTAAPAPAPTVAEGAKQMQQRVADDVSKALQQGAAKRAEQP
ncbi:MAG: hypothetical protein MUC32_07965 [Burkholderiaceae bacterium]|jgi:hypothetical protein|nr:hypothetical protein [Burkholderiaceae bacterium]MCU0928390.1 hypothetical protein [Burkholderiaceae bacterium]